ncbi:hypothetical protein [Actinoplanes sp. NPDC051851]|uniref:hypothetical protein n=1 Tax=Actinoplanes sp. NPDC051851 TaxID=3154753 RepID=UPI003437DB07
MLPSLRELAVLSGLSPVALPVLPQSPEPPRAPSWAVFPGAARAALAGSPEPSSWSPARRQAPPTVSAPVCSLPRALGDGPAGGVASRAVPAVPAVPLPPVDRPGLGGQARDAGGGTAPTTGTVPSSWRPEVTVTGRRAAVDRTARGRTVRYLGPPR